MSDDLVESEVHELLLTISSGGIVSFNF